MEGVAGLASLIVHLDGVPYSRDDLYGCDDCEFVSVTNDPLDDMNRCSDCAKAAEEFAAETEDHRRWYRAVAR